MMPMMHQMMQMMQGEMIKGMAANISESSAPDLAFVRAMIPHHQSAVDMARAVLKHGKDERVKKWANQIIEAQEAEIAEMQGWLKEHGE